MSTSLSILSKRNNIRANPSTSDKKIKTTPKKSQYRDDAHPTNATKLQKTKTQTQRKPFQKKERDGTRMLVGDVQEIKRLEFGVFSAKEIIAMAACEITSVKVGELGEINDNRMGTMEDKIACGSCRKGIKECPGHFGFMRLALPVIHPLTVFQKKILMLLRAFCHDCSKFLIQKETIELMDLPDNHSERKKKLREYAIDTSECPHCKQPQPVFFMKDGIYTMSYSKKSGTKRRPVTTEKIKYVFENIDPEDFRLSGGIPEMVQPKDLIITVLPVLPPCARPYVISGGKICDDDLTAKYNDILKHNIKLQGNMNEKDRAKTVTNLIFHIKTLMDNSHGKAKLSKGRALKCIKQRMNGKGRLIRGHLMGKRVDFTARTVVGPGPELRTGEVGIPIEMRETLTYPEIVNSLNIKELENTVNVDNEAVYVIGNSGARFPMSSVLWNEPIKLLRGDMINRDGIEIDPFAPTHAKNNIKGENDGFVHSPSDLIIRNGVKIPIKMRSKKFFKLHIGDTVERKLRDGDIVILNRQPSLHKGSMLGKRVRLMKGKTIRFNLATTKTFNADFDGDEMNIHVPQGPQAVVESRSLFSTQSNIVSQQGSQCNITLVQDAILGCYLMSKENYLSDSSEFFNICMAGDSGKSKIPDGFEVDHILSGVQHYQDVLTELHMPIKPEEAYTSRCLLSLILPRDFCYQSKNDGMVDQPVVKIYKGVIFEGSLTSKNLSSSNRSITRIIEKEYGGAIAMTFIDNAQFITGAWLLDRGFSVGMADCLTNKKEEIQDTVTMCFLEADRVVKITENERLRELKLNAALNKARDIGRKMAKDSMAVGNSLAVMPTSGAKGSFVNIAQISGLLGQQNLTGNRIQPVSSCGTRTLPCYDKYDSSYESRGFVRESFYTGLTPTSMFFHAMSGREGLTDTAVKTRSSGYIQRKLVKCMEDCQVLYDGTVRTSNNTVIQFNYGEKGLDGSKLVNVNGTYQSSDIKRMSEILNMSYRADRDKKKKDKKDKKKKKDKKDKKKKKDKKDKKKKKDKKDKKGNNNQ
jgi:DNA-directed RNA polymerase beta' subunit